MTMGTICNRVQRGEQSSQSQAICQVRASRGDQKLDLRYAPLRLQQGRWDHYAGIHDGSITAE